MHKVQRMDPALGPPNCLTCGRGNSVDEPDTMDDFWVMDLERDVNWGDPCYICKYCCHKIAEQCGHVPLEAFEELQAVIAQKNEEIHTAEAQRDSWRRKARGVRLGKKAVQSVRRSS